MKRRMPKAGTLTGLLAVFAAGAAYSVKQTARGTDIQLYYIWDVLAALLLFSIGFTIVAVVILNLVLLERGLDRAVTWTKPYTAQAALRLHRGSVQVGQFGRRHYHRSAQP